VEVPECLEMVGVRGMMWVYLRALLRVTKRLLEKSDAFDGVQLHGKLCDQDR
jgi:hypothetical protein